MPKFKGPEVDLSLKKPDIDLALPKAKADIKGPAIDVQLPSCAVSVEAPDVDIGGGKGKFKMPHMKMPKFGISAPDIKAPKLDLDVSLPKVKGEIDADVSLRKPKVDVTVPDVSVDIKGPKADINIPMLDVEAGSAEINIEGPDGNFKMPTVKMPHFGMSMPKFRGPKVDLSLKKPDIDLTLPTGKADLKGPEIHVQLPSCEVDVEAPDINTGGKKGKFKMPHMKMPKFGISAPDIKAPKLDLDVNLPKVKGEIVADVNLSKPKVDLAVPDVSAHIKGPKADINVPTMDVETGSAEMNIEGPDGKFNMPTVKMPHFEISMPKFKGTDVDIGLKKPDIDVNLPKAEGHIKGPEIDIHTPTVELDTGSAELNFEGPDGKLKMPKVKKPYFGFSMPKFKSPEVDLSLKKPDIDLALPKGKAGMKGPEVDVQLPSCEVDVEAPDVDVGGTKGKFKMPHMKMPKFGISGPDIKAPKLDLDVSLPKVKGEIDGDVTFHQPKVDITVPDVSADIKGTKADISIPTMDVEAGSAEINIEDPDGKFKLPTVKIPHFGISMTKFKGPEVDLNLKKPDIDVKMPKAERHIKGPEIEVDLPSCEIDVEASDLDTGGAKGKFKMPHMKMPKFGMSGPDIKAPKLDLDVSLQKGDLDVSLPKVKGEIDADITLHKPKVDVAVSDVSADIKGPKADINIPMVDVEPGSAEINIEGPDGKFKLPTVKVPHFGISLPKFKGPEVDLSLKKPDIDVKLPTTEGDIKGPEIDIHAPTMDLDTGSAELNIEGPDGKFKMPKIKKPHFTFSMPKFKGPELDISRKNSDIDITLSKPKVAIKGPGIDVDASSFEADVENLDVEIGKAKGKFKMPHIKGSKFGFSALDIKAPKFDLEFSLAKADIDVSAPNADIKPGKLDGNFGIEHLSFEGPDSSLKMPKVEVPSLDVSLPKVKGEIDAAVSLSKPQVDVTLPDVSADIKGPVANINIPTMEVEVGSAEMNIEGTDGKVKMPKAKKPHFRFLMPKFKGPEMDIGRKKPDIDITLSKPKADIKGPEIDIEVPSCEVHAEAPDVDIGGTKGKFKMLQMKMPKFGISMEGEIDANVSLSKSKVDVTLEILDPSVSASLKGTEKDISIGKCVVDVKGLGKGSKLSGKLNNEETEFNVGIPDSEITGGKISLGDIDGNLFGTKLKGSALDCDVQVDIKSSEPDLGLSVLDTNAGSKIEAKQSTYGVSLLKVSSPTAQCESGIDGAGSILTSVNIIQPKLKQVTDTSTSGPTFGGVFEGHGDDTDIKTKAVPGKVKFKLPRIGLSEAESTQSVPELKGQKDSDVVPLKTTEATKTKTSWFKFPKISFSSPWRKEKQETEVGKNLEFLKMDPSPNNEFP
uniref:AHNAK nucleoprotein n=1 Tax=Callorhinchus milii TaxID=7868 RepID=A0A4W3IN41_CALMI